MGTTPTPAAEMWRNRARDNRDQADLERGRAVRLARENATLRQEKADLVEARRIARTRERIFRRRLRDAGLDDKVTRDQIDQENQTKETNS